MIRIHKPAAPIKLIQDASKKTEAHLQDYLQDPAYSTGEKQFRFSPKTYAHTDVRELLMDCQHQKCCYCEKNLGQSGDIEHFRPKSAYKQKNKQPLQYPGYYWLAYDWENLYLSCRDCNLNKANYFPLKVAKNRAQLHKNSISLEKPLLIDPEKSDPEKHIEFIGQYPYSKSRSKQGQITIDILKLDREDLNSSRFSHLDNMKMLYKLIQKAEEYPDDRDLNDLALRSQKILNYALSDRGIFSSATRSAIADGFREVNTASNR